MMVIGPRESARMNVSSSFESRFERTWNNPSWWNLLVVLPFALCVIVSLYNCRADQITAAREQTAFGEIVSHDRPNHNRFGYQFAVKGRMYTGWAIPSTDYEIGQKVLVYYDPLDPDKSQLDDFAENGYRIIGPASFCLLGICGVSLYIFLRRRAIRANQAQP
jgi:hypothetical protein